MSCFVAGSGFTSIGVAFLASWTSCSGASSVSGVASAARCAAFSAVDGSVLASVAPEPSVGFF